MLTSTIQSDPRGDDTGVAAEDHRVRVARERRERTHRRLLDTILATYRGDQDRGPAVLDEILKNARTSKANFYKYFPSLDAAVRKLGEQLSDEMTVTIQSVYTEVTDRRGRLAIGFQLFLIRAAADPSWGNFVAHGAYLHSGHQLMLRVREDFEQGANHGDFMIADIDAAIGLTIGAMVEGIRHVISHPPSRLYIETLTMMVLGGLGVPALQAHTLVKRTSTDLHWNGGGIFNWWKPF
jgi:AcrR family transcriptional regulator